MANQNPSASDLILAIQLLADSKQAVKSVQLLEKELERLGVTTTKTKANLASLGKADMGTQPAQSVNKLNQALEKTPQATKNATSGLFSLRNMARTALGTFEAMAIFFVSQFVGQAITKVIDSLKQLELSFYRIGIAERALSNAGVNINPQELADIAQRVTETYATVSQIDALKMVSNLAVLTKDLDLTAEQYEKIATAIPLIAQQSDVSIESATDQIITGLTKSGRGWADLGITVDAAIIRQKAVTDGIVESAEAYDALTAEQKQQVEVLALINILNENALENLDSQEQFLTTIAGKQALLTKEWETLTTEMGKLGSPALKSGFDTIIWLIQQLIIQVEYARLNYITFMGVIVGGGMAIREVMRGNIQSVEEFVQVFNQASTEAKRALEVYMSPTVGEDTPTADVPEVDESVIDNQEDLQEALEKMNDEILESQIRLAQDMEDAQIDLGRKLVDIATEYAKKRADAERDYANDIRDIQADYRDDIADIEADQAEDRQERRNDELQKEAEFQNRMQELRENFLMDLEDALHARDARQVLRLTKQYALDKLQAERQRELERENSQREQAEANASFQRRRRDAERERRARLQEAQQEYQDKLAQLQAEEQAEREKAELDYQRKMEDLEREMQNRLEIVGANLIAEYDLTQEGLQAILELYRRYYQEIAGIYQAMNAMLAGQQNLNQSTGSGGSTKGNKSTGGGSNKLMAEGGTIIADKPTQVTFGEAGLEQATFTPLGRTGRDTNKVFSNLSGDGMGGRDIMELLVTLSPDLRAQIVQEATGNVAGVITKISRSKN